MALIEKKAMSKWDAELNRKVCNRYNNCDLTITLKLFLDKVDPAGGAASQMFPDAGGTNRKIVRWGAKWSTWTTKFRRDCEKAWHGKFWLKCPDSLTKWDYTDKGVTYRPNIWCRFRLKLVNSAGAAHHSIQCVRLDSAVPFFRSHSGLYDHRDIVPVPQAHGSKKKTHVHEVGHLLGLPHVGVDGPIGIGWAKCLINVAVGGSTNDSVCYGASPEEKRDIMGSGSVIRPWHAAPWQEAIGKFSGLAKNMWRAETRRHYPRSLAEVRSKKWHHSKPSRG